MGNSRSNQHDHSRDRAGNAAGGRTSSYICTAVLGSMTQAMKAQNVLAAAAIRSTVTKISSSKAHNGCAYGLEFPCAQAANVRMVLDRAGITVRQYFGGAV